MARGERMRVWVTKGALEVGIREFNVEHTGIEDTVKVPGFSLLLFHGEGREWHRTREAAVTRAEEMRARKIASLLRSVEALRAREFG